MRVFQIHEESTKYIVWKDQKSDFMLLFTTVKEWRALVVRRTRERTAKWRHEASIVRNRFNLLSSIFLSWQRAIYVQVVSREHCAEKLDQLARKCLVAWEKWAYKVFLSRKKWARTYPLQLYFRHLFVGCRVQRLGDLSVIRKCFGRWVENWTYEWKTKGENWSYRCLTKMVFREWKWCVLWIGSEKKFVSEECEGEQRGGERLFDYRPRMRIRKEEEVKEGGEGGEGRAGEGGEGRTGTGAGAGAEQPGAVQQEAFLTQAQVQAQARVERRGIGISLVPLSSGPLYGRSAVDLYRNTVVAKKTFKWWTGISDRTRTLRRNLGALSRLASFMKKKDAFSRFPGATLKAKVDRFVKKRITRSVFAEWKLISRSYLKRKGDEERSGVLRNKSERGMQEQIMMGEREEEDANWFGRGGEKSFLMRVGAGDLRRLGKAWRGWRDIAARGRQARYARGMKLKEKERALKRTVFGEWADATHFINRRHSWGEALGQRAREKPGGPENALRDRSAGLMNYMNSMGKAAVESSYVGKSTERWVEAAGAGSREVMERIAREWRS